MSIRIFADTRNELADEVVGHLEEGWTATSEPFRDGGMWCQDLDFLKPALRVLRPLSSIPVSELAKRGPKRTKAGAK